ncbi:MAG TPA: hypothetical protein DCY03_28285 [Planctomycetaceae bacterium]|nr:hypothetical protein [Planctomycetaceae bacterium]|tara:strand:- start:5538 stop:6131 length:594 start_codon:yes stop_codon:yes gene_type:complete
MKKPRKQIKHFHEPGDLHELTFSCYQRKPLLTNQDWNKLLCQSIDRALKSQKFRLISFVIMPEHLHLFVYPVGNECRIDRFLAAIKRPFSYRIKEQLVQLNSPLLNHLTTTANSGKNVFHFWQKGPGYDRNLTGRQAVLAAINYIHQNPVQRKLVRNMSDWKWSSARWYESDGNTVDPDLPVIHGLPWEFFATASVE